MRSSRMRWDTLVPSPCSSSKSANSGKVSTANTAINTSRYYSLLPHSCFRLQKAVSFTAPVASPYRHFPLMSVLRVCLQIFRLGTYVIAVLVAVCLVLVGIGPRAHSSHARVHCCVHCICGCMMENKNAVRVYVGLYCSFKLRDRRTDIRTDASDAHLGHPTTAGPTHDASPPLPSGFSPTGDDASGSHKAGSRRASLQEPLLEVV